MKSPRHPLRAPTPLPFPSPVWLPCGLHGLCPNTTVCFLPSVAVPWPRWVACPGDSRGRLSAQRTTHSATARAPSCGRRWRARVPLTGCECHSKHYCGQVLSLRPQPSVCGATPRTAHTRTEALHKKPWYKEFLCPLECTSACLVFFLSILLGLPLPSLPPSSSSLMPRDGSPPTET